VWVAVVLTLGDILAKVFKLATVFEAVSIADTVLVRN
jgi:hypothetical protein